MTVKVTRKKLEQALETYAGLVEVYPDNEDYLQRYADMLQSLGREATATTTLQHLHDIIAKRSEDEAKKFAKQYPQIGRISLEEIFDAQDSHIMTGKVVFELLGNLWLRLHRKTLKEGQAVCHADEVSDSLILVLNGYVDVYAPDNKGNKVLLESVGLYDVIGEHTFFMTNTFGFDAFVSSESATVVKVPRKKLQTMVENNHHLKDMLTQRTRFRSHIQTIALHPIFKSLPLKLSKYLARHIQIKSFPKKSMIIPLEQQIEDIYIILSGKAHYLARNKSGDRLPLDPLPIQSLAGDILLQGKKEELSNELYASTQVKVAIIPHEQLRNISAAFPPLMERLVQHAEQQQQQIAHNLAQRV